MVPHKKTWRRIWDDKRKKGTRYQNFGKKERNRYDNGRQWKRISKTSGNYEDIANFFLFL